MSFRVGSIIVAYCIWTWHYLSMLPRKSTQNGTDCVLGSLHLFSIWFRPRFWLGHCNTWIFFEIKPIFCWIGCMCWVINMLNILFISSSFWSKMKPYPKPQTTMLPCVFPLAMLLGYSLNLGDLVIFFLSFMMFIHFINTMEGGKIRITWWEIAVAFIRNGNVYIHT